MNRNRLKLWLYMLLFLLAGAANLFLLTGDLAALALKEADTGLRVGAAHLHEAERLMASEAAAVTGLAVKSAELLEALFAAPPRADSAKKKGKAAPPSDEATEAAAQARFAAAEAAARAAVEEAASRLAINLPPGAWWAVASPEWLQKKLDEALQDPQRKEAAAFLRDAARGAPRRGYAHVNDGLWYGVAYPAGEGAALVLFLPLDLAWAKSMAAATGLDVTLDVATPQLITTAPAEQAKRLAKSAANATAPVSEGEMPLVMLQQPVAVRVPVLFVNAPAARAISVKLTGLPKGHMILSIPTVGYFTELARYQWAMLVGMAALALVGLLLGVLVKTEVLPQVPATLVAAAARIERGEYSARAPEFLGALGTVAGALNKAAAAAEAATTRSAQDPFAPPAEPSFVLPPEPSFVFPPAPPFQPPPAPFAPPPATLPGFAPPPPPGEPVARDTTAPIGPAAFPFPPAPQPRPPGPAPTSVFQAVTPPAVPEETEDEHWRAVHQEFLRVRAECGEPTEGLGFDRFKPKLEKNREQLMQRHGCRTVRFSVYVKDGKAALRATPVK
jgi:hypothetical protein